MRIKVGSPIQYYQVKSSTETPCLYYNFKIERKGYELAIYYDNNAEDSQRYQICLRSTKKRPDNNLDFEKVQNILNEFGFKEHSEWNGYWCFFKDYNQFRNNTIKLLQYLTVSVLY